MKQFIIRILNIVIGLLVLGSALYAVFGVTMLYLPEEWQTRVFEWLRLTPETLATFSVSAIINVVLFATNWAIRLNSKKQLLQNEIVMNNNIFYQTQMTKAFEGLKALTEKVADSQTVLVDKGEKQRSIIADIVGIAQKLKGGQSENESN
jgi:hypothetical protein